MEKVGHRAVLLWPGSRSGCSPWAWLGSVLSRGTALVSQLWATDSAQSSGWVPPPFPRTGYCAQGHLLVSF